MTKNTFGKLEITEMEKEILKSMGCIGIMSFEGNRVAFITRIESNDTAETSFVEYAIGNVNNKKKRSRMYDNIESTKFVVNGKRYDVYEDIQML